MKKILLIAVAVLTLTACSDVLDKQVNVKTFNEDVEKIKDKYPDRYVETDFQMLDAALLGKFFGSDQKVTYRQILDQAKEEREEKEAEYQRELTEYNEKKAEFDRQVGKLTAALPMEIGSFGFTQRYFSEYAEIKYTLTNNSDKEIARLEGRVLVSRKDGRGRPVVYDIELKETIGAGKSVGKTFSAYYNEFSDDQKLIRNVLEDELDLVWEPRYIRYSDGSVLEAPDKPREPKAPSHDFWDLGLDDIFDMDDL